jgi:hypothetical protein
MGRERILARGLCRTVGEADYLDCWLVQGDWLSDGRKKKGWLNLWLMYYDNPLATRPATMHNAPL